MTCSGSPSCVHCAELSLQEDQREFRRVTATDVDVQELIQEFDDGDEPCHWRPSQLLNMLGRYIDCIVALERKTEKQSIRWAEDGTTIERLTDAIELERETRKETR